MPERVLTSRADACRASQGDSAGLLDVIGEHRRCTNYDAGQCINSGGVVDSLCIQVECNAPICTAGSRKLPPAAHVL